MYSKYLGIPYKTNGRSIEEGFDCYGLLIDIQKNYAHKHLVDCINGEAEKLNVEKIENLEELCIIDINIINEVLHVATYIGEGMMIHTRKDVGVCIEPVYRYEHWIKGYYKVTD